MRWNIGIRERGFHRWFAWFPVRLRGTNTVVWLEWVERQITDAQGWKITDYRKGEMTP